MYSGNFSEFLQDSSRMQVENKPIINMLAQNVEKNIDEIQTFETLASLPQSPMLPTIGFGTGCYVFTFKQPVDSERPSDSTWAVKSVSRTLHCEKTKEMSLKRLLKEIDILRSLDHPNIVGFRGCKMLSDGRPLLAMEMCDDALGAILSRRFESKMGPLPANNINKVCLDICAALDYLHNEAHWLHGDVKSYNILINNDFEICKLCDFGVSVRLNTHGYIDLEQNEKPSYDGTPMWSAPETVTDAVEHISTKSDIYSFGLVIYECITCDPPPSGTGETDDSEESFPIRPNLPLVETLGDEYKALIKLYYICTEELPDERPPARIILTKLQG